MAAVASAPPQLPASEYFEEPAAARGHIPDELREHHQVRNSLPPGVRRQHRRRRLLDVYADSLRHVNRMYTKRYGGATRKVPAHMPHFLQKSVLEAMHDRFPDQFAATASHRFRHSQDMQFSFSYFYYLMSELKTFDVHSIELDANHDG